MQAKFLMIFGIALAVFIIFSGCINPLEQPICGNEVCEAGENFGSCPQDCSIEPKACEAQGGSICAANLECNGKWIAANDTERCCNGICQARQYCGNGICDGDETSLNCPSDCNCLEVLPNHNNRDANRINIILIADEFLTEQELDNFKEMVSGNLGITGDDNGIFSREPFKSNMQNFNFWEIAKPQSIGCINTGNMDWSNPRSCTREFLYEEALQDCGIGDRTPGNREIVVLVDMNFETQLVTSWAVGGFSTIFVNLKRIMSDEETRNLEERSTAHEFAHSFGYLGDEYQSYTRLATWGVVNCEHSFACPKWCSGASDYSDPFSIETACQEIETSSECNSTDFNGFECDWDYFREQYPNIGQQSYPNPCHAKFMDSRYPVNLGKDCIEGSGCYYGCGGIGGFRSAIEGYMMESEDQIYNVFNVPSIIGICQRIPNATGYCNSFS